MSFSSVALLTGHLSKEQQQGIVNELLEKIQNLDNVNSNPSQTKIYISTLCQLVNSIPSISTQIYQNILVFTQGLLKNENLPEYYESISLLTREFPNLANALMSQIESILSQFIISNPIQFNEQLKNLILTGNSSPDDDSLTTELITSILTFTEWYFMNHEEYSNEFKSSTFDNLCYVYLSNENSDLAKAASKTLRWRMSSISQSSISRKFFWDIVFLLADSKDKNEISYSYTLWLRYFNYHKLEKLKESNEFQDLLSMDKYWWKLRDGLISQIHEHKKFSLTLIQMSVRSLSRNLETPIISWDVSKEDQYLDSWKRFCTLYEILGIDTAMNQAEAAKNDLIKIFNPDSLLPIPFALTIPSVGFRAAMEKVKKFSLNLLFALPEKSMSLFKYDMKFISQVFLPFTMKSNHFNAKTNQDGTFDCPFGDQLRDFISNCITSMDSNEFVCEMVGNILNVLYEDRLTFGIARIHIIWGVLKGLEKLQALALNMDNVQILNKLFDSTAEGGILQTTLQTIHLKLMLHMNPIEVDLKTIIQSLGLFIQINGFEIFNENEEFFLDFFNTHYPKNEINDLLIEDGNNLDVNSFTILTSVIIQNGAKISDLVPSILSHPLVYKLIIQFTNSGFELNGLWTEPLIISKIEKLINEMVNGSKDLPMEIYKECGNFLNNEKLFGIEFWESLEIEPFFKLICQELIEIDDMESIKDSIYQFYFIEKCIEKCIFNPNFNIKLETLVQLIPNVMKSIPRGTDVTFYKSKDETVSLILKIATQLMSINEFTETFKENIMKISSNVVSLSEYYSHSANVELLVKYIDTDNSNEGFTLKDAKSILISLDLIWQDLIKDRLILNQRDLHQKFISLLMNSKLLKFSIEDEELASEIFKLADDVINQSGGRKALLPYLLQSIVNYQVNFNEDFEKTTWLAKVISKATFLRQSDLNIFKLDVLVSSEYDKTLNLSGRTLYSQIYGKPEMSYRVDIMTICACAKNSEFGKELWGYILGNEQIFHLMQPKKRTDSEEQWKRIQLYSILLITYELLDKETCLHFMNTKILPRLFKEASPLVRMYMEWIIALTLHKYPESQEQIFEIFQDGIENQQPLIITIFERVSILVAKNYTKDKEVKFLSDFVSKIIIPTATSNRALNRHFSSSMACVIYKEIKDKKLDNFPNELLNTLTRIYEVATMGDSWAHYRTGDALIWDIFEDFNLVSVSGGVLLKISDRQIDAIYQRFYDSFVSEEQKKFLRYPIGHDEPDRWVEAPRVDEVRFDVAIDEYDEESSLLQTKSGAWSTVMEVDENGRAASQIKRSPLIVVSSLVDKPPNLGGICRLCDCLGAGWMTMDDLSVKDNAEFKSVAVTADRWMPMVEVKMDDIAEFMRMKKKEGYTLIGLEQTDKSIELNGDLKFPEKSLILIGKEREGIPGDLLAELDMCVIIKQVGIVRSMNIQTATAVIVQAYSSQHC